MIKGLNTTAHLSWQSRDWLLLKGYSRSCPVTRNDPLVALSQPSAGSGAYRPGQVLSGNPPLRVTSGSAERSESF
jgi:hypothetical protein